MAERKDSYIGPIYVPETSEIVPVILSGSSLSIFERNFNTRTTPNFSSASYNTKEIGNTSLADCSLTNLRILTGTITNINVESKFSTDNYATWSNALSIRGVWTASSTPYNIRFEVPVQFVRNKPGSMKYDFRLSFYGASTKAKIQPYNDTTYATGFVALRDFPTSSEYSKSGSLQFNTYSFSTVITNFPYLTGGNIVNRIVTFESSAGAVTYYSSQAFCVTTHGPNATASVRYMQLLASSCSYAVPEHWGQMFYSGGKYTMSIDNSYIVAAQIKFNGIDDFSEIVGVISNSAYIGSTWTDNGTAADSTLRIGWKSMYGAPSGWYTSSNPYITYSFNPLTPAFGQSGSVYVQSQSFYNISEYIIFMWVSTGSVSLPEGHSALPSIAVPGATASISNTNATGAGDWYLYDRIPAPKILPSGGISGTNPDIEYVVSNLPRTKTVSFWVGTIWENTLENQQDRGRYEYSDFIISGASDNIKNVITRNKKETIS